MPVEVLLTFFAASVVLAVAPGPDNIFVLVQSALHGRQSGIFVTLGLCTGLIVHTTAAAIGVASILKVSTLAFMTLKIIGAAYLLFLSWQSFRASVTSVDYRETKCLNSFQMYRRGVFMNITNPKVAIFFLAFLPQFVNSSYGAVLPQFFILGGIFIAATALVFGTVAFLAGIIGNVIYRSPRAQKIMNCIAGTVLAALAIKLAAVRS